MLTLGDSWVWDFWLAREGGHHHVFYLCAPRSLGDPERRHFNVTIEFCDEEEIWPHYDNEPDTFRLWIVDGGGLLNNTTEASSYHNSSSCHVHWGL